jgi:signal transduction histidine kinase
MKDLSLHILDIAENSIRAGAKLVEISIIEDAGEDVLILQIKDNGKGMEKDTMREAADPFFTTKSGKRIGMGIPLLAQASREAGGKFEISSTPETGTSIRTTFRYSHPDRKPLGDISETLKTLIVGNPGVDFFFEHRKGTEVTCFDTRKGGQS